MKKNAQKITMDILLIAVVSIISFFIFAHFDALETLVEISCEYEHYEIDELVSTSIVLCFCLTWFSIRRWREATNKNNILDQRNKELQSAYEEIKQLKGILPLCSFCKKIRDDSGYWEQVDVYLQKHTDADISHGICPECMEKNYPEPKEEI